MTSISQSTILKRLGLLLALASVLPACTPAKPVAEAQYAAQIMGTWLGTVGA